MARKPAKSEVLDLSAMDPKEFSDAADQIFADAQKAGKGGNLADAFSPARVDALAGLMTAIGQTLPPVEIERLKKMGEKKKGTE